MRVKEVIEIQTETYLEEQYILDKFPEAVWVSGVRNYATFYLPKSREKVVSKVLKEWDELYNKNGKG